MLRCFTLSNLSKAYVSDAKNSGITVTTTVLENPCFVPTIEKKSSI